jgi:predicted transcriptional regulator of viral defense system
LVPKGTICLLSALQFHDLATQNPFDFWVAIGHKDREPSVDAVFRRTVRMSGAAHTEGTQDHDIEGVSVPVRMMARTASPGAPRVLEEILLQGEGGLVKVVL